MNLLKYLLPRSHPPGVSGNTQNPVFIFASCWRSGSTLLQRIVNASGEVFIWGEPAFLAEAQALFHRMEECLAKGGSRRQSANISGVGRWIPVLSPPPQRATEAFKDLFSAIYHQETAQLGFKRWGFKEVRPQAADRIRMLIRIYPEADFIFLVRNPYHTFRSLKGKKFHAKFKDPFQPIKVWRDNVEELLNDDPPATRCLVVKYEELIEQSRLEHRLLEAIGNHLRLPVTEKMFKELEVKTDSSGGGMELSSEEKERITSIVGETAPRLGYRLL